MLIFKKGFNT